PRSVMSRVRAGPLQRLVNPRSGRSQTMVTITCVSVHLAKQLPRARCGRLPRPEWRVAPRIRSRKHRTELVNGHRIVAFHQHVPAPLADSDHEEFDLEIGGRLPLTEYLEDSLLGILVLHG